jgi:hypothetical protein
MGEEDKDYSIYVVAWAIACLIATIAVVKREVEKGEFGPRPAIQQAAQNAASR